MMTYLKIWGDLACFSRPEMKVERVSYPLITPSAARGIFEAILYKPQFRWRIHRIAVKRPIRFLAFRRNEVKAKLPANKIRSWMGGEPVETLFADDERTQRNTLALRDVEYVIEASIALTPLANLPRRKPLDEDEPQGDDNPGKYYGMFQRRAEKGQCFHRPCLGCREFPAHFELADESAMSVPVGFNPNADLGLILYEVFDLDRTYPNGKATVASDPKMTFYRAELKDGIVAVPSWESVKAQLRGGAV